MIELPRQLGIDGSEGPVAGTHAEPSGIFGEDRAAFCDGEAMRNVARATDALRRGWAVTIFGHDGPLRLLPLETATHAAVADFSPAGGHGLLISKERAAALTSSRSGLQDEKAVYLGRTTAFDLADAMLVADPSLEPGRTLDPAWLIRSLEARHAAHGALELARTAGILPAYLVSDDGRCHATADAAAILASGSASDVRIVARARLPMEALDRAEIVAFRSVADAAEHIALMLGRPNGRPPLVRLHSECLTGDALGSLKCDCGPQLDRALARIASEGWGILLYLRQEGRGIGLVNKLRAYALQDRGLDTIDANLDLGFPEDARSFAGAAAMLSLLGFKQIRLLTNNPAKAAGLAAAGIEVIERLAHRTTAHSHNAGYLATKRIRSGHLL